MTDPTTIKAAIVESQTLYMRATYLGNGIWAGGFFKSTIQEALECAPGLVGKHFEIIEVDLQIPADKSSVKVLSDDLNNTQNKIFELDQKHRAALAEIEYLKQTLLKPAKEARKPPHPAVLVDANTEHDVPAKNARTAPALRAKGAP
jgi:hypothetical protein